MDFGKATGFRKYYGEESDFVQMVGGIADAIQMCQPQKFQEAIQEFAEYLKSGQYVEDDPYLQIFVEFMKNDYGLLLEEPDNTIEQIRWRVHKEFYQQALTIYIERMPKYYYDCGIVVMQLDENERSGRGTNPYADAFYKDLFDDILEEMDEILNNVLTELAAQEDWHEERNVPHYLKIKLEKMGNHMVSDAVVRLMKDMEKMYGCDGNLVGAEFIGSPKTIQGYINSVCGDHGKGERRQLLYGYKPKQKDTFTKKIMAIKAAKEIRPGCVRIMEYYLAMKLLRNRVNHASEGESDEDEQRAITFLQSEQLDLGIDIKGKEMKFDYHKIKKLLIDALEYFRC